MVVLAIALVFGVLAVVRQGDEIAAALDEIDWLSVLASFAATIVGLLGIYRSWAVIVRDGGVDLSTRQSLRIYGIGQVGKYVPGSVWSVLSQAEMVREHGGSRLRMATASLVALLVSVTVALVLGGLLLPVSGSEAERTFWFAPFAAVALAGLLIPAVLNALVDRVNRFLRRPPNDVRFSGRAIAKAAGWALLANLFFGLQIQALGHELGNTGIDGYLLSTCAYALAAALGVLVVLAPAGAGVREVVLTVVLAPTLSVGAALTVALVSRVVSMAADFALALSQVRRIKASDPGARQPVFVTRRFPPSVGGMETLALSVWRSMLEVRPDAVLIAHGGSNRGLVGWIPRAWFRLAWLVLRGRVEFVLTGDALMYSLVDPLLRLARIRRATMILGLDVTYSQRVYRLLVHSALRRAPQVVAISAATRDAAVTSGVPAARVGVLRLGVEAPAWQPTGRSRARVRVHAELGVTSDAVLLLTLGRLVRRKGSRWFVETVLPGLPGEVHYVVAGDGPERVLIEEAANRSGVADRVHVLGPVNDPLRDDLMAGCDLFVQPNIAVPGDMEGFGLVTIESAMRGTPVVAADLEGLRDAVLPGRTGILLPSEDGAQWIRTLGELVADRDALDSLGESYRLVATDLYSEKAMGAELCRMVGLSTDAAPEAGTEPA